MITLENDELVFRFPKVHKYASCSIEFQRTLRIPNDDKRYPLPPGMGSFPLRHLDDYLTKLDEQHRSRGGVIMPMHQSEAMWIQFDSEYGYPHAIKIATGKICAVSGESWFNHLNQDPQDYVVIPEQPWLDGYCVEKGTIRQFVAAPLGSGHTVEEQLTGEADVGGIQIVVYPMKREFYDEHVSPPSRDDEELRVYSASAPTEQPSNIMGLAAGGKMSQQIYEDEWGLHAWDMRNGKRCFVTMFNSEQWLRLAGELPPGTPPSAKEYARCGLPWFDYYTDAPSVEGSKKLAGVKPIGELDSYIDPTSEDTVKIDPGHVIPLGKTKKGPREVREFLD